MKRTSKDYFITVEHEWDVWEIPKNFVSWSYIQIYWLKNTSVLATCSRWRWFKRNCGLFILTDETKIVIESIHAFKKYNESWPKTHPVISDKGFNERNAFSSCFSSAQLLICVYHTFRSSRPEMFRKKTFSVNFAKFLRTYFFTEHLCSCFCTLRWLRREINCEKIGIISAQPANCLEILR